MNSLLKDINCVVSRLSRFSGDATFKEVDFFKNLLPYNPFFIIPYFGVEVITLLFYVAKIEKDRMKVLEREINESDYLINRLKKFKKK